LTLIFTPSLAYSYSASGKSDGMDKRYPVRESLWCCKNNSILGFGEGKPDKEMDLSLVPCIRVQCPGWAQHDHDCIHLKRSIKSQEKSRISFAGNRV
jgi:hypothetical protein